MPDPAPPARRTRLSLRRVTLQPLRAVVMEPAALNSPVLGSYSCAESQPATKTRPSPRSAVPSPQNGMGLSVGPRAPLGRSDPVGLNLSVLGSNSSAELRHPPLSGVPGGKKQGGRTGPGKRRARSRTQVGRSRPRLNCHLAAPCHAPGLEGTQSSAAGKSAVSASSATRS